MVTLQPHEHPQQLRKVVPLALGVVRDAKGHTISQRKNCLAVAGTHPTPHR